MREGRGDVCMFACVCACECVYVCVCVCVCVCSIIHFRVPAFYSTISSISTHVIIQQITINPECRTNFRHDHFRYSRPQFLFS